MGVFKFLKSQPDASIGPELAAVLPKDAKPWYRTRHLIILNLLLLVPLLSSAAVGYDGSMMNGLQTLPQWRNYFANPDAPLLGTINAMYQVGKVLALAPVTWMSDRYGRKLPMQIGLVLLIVTAIFQAASQNIAMFIVSRLLIGISTVFIAATSPVMITELAYPTLRGKCTGLYNTFFYFGAILAAWATFGTFKLADTWSWRIPSALQAGFPCLQFIFIWFLPESPRWLVSKGRGDEARLILTRLHAGGDENSPLVNYEMKEIEDYIRLESLVSTQSSYLDLVRTAPNRRRTLIAVMVGFFAQWNGIGVVSYYLTLVLNTIGITDPERQTLINGLLQIFNFAAAVFGGALMIDRIGRRKLFLIGTGGLLCSYIAWTALTAQFVQTNNASLGQGVLAFIFIAYFFYDIAWTPLLYAYPVEIFPFTLRARGLSTTLLSTYIGLIIAQFVNPIALKSIGWQYYIVFCCILACLTTAIYFLFPETKGRSLEEIAEIFDGKRAVAIQAGLKNEDDVAQHDEKAAGSTVRAA